jgi:predicted nucleic acid-binding protein
LVMLKERNLIPFKLSPKSTMTVFADSSWWVPFKCRKDLRHRKAISLFELIEGCDLLWTPWHRVEVFNTIRQITRYEADLIDVAEAKLIIRRLEEEVHLGYYQHFEFDWRDAVRTACTMSAQISFTHRVRSMDLFHVAIAQEAKADFFVSFDEDASSGCIRGVKGFRCGEVAGSVMNPRVGIGGAFRGPAAGGPNVAGVKGETCRGPLRFWSPRPCSLTLASAGAESVVLSALRSGETVMVCTRDTFG